MRVGQNPVSPLFREQCTKVKRITQILICGNKSAFEYYDDFKALLDAQERKLKSSLFMKFLKGCSTLKMAQIPDC